MFEHWAVDFEEHNSARPFYFTTRNVVPSVLHTSQEARKTALLHYTLTHACNFDLPIGLKPDPFAQTYPPPSIYINWKCDIICPLMGDTSYSKLFMYNVCRLPRLRRLALDAAATVKHGLLSPTEPGGLDIIGIFIAKVRRPGKAAEIMLYQWPMAVSWSRNLGLDLAVMGGDELAAVPPTWDRSIYVWNCTKGMRSDLPGVAEVLHQKVKDDNKASVKMGRTLTSTTVIVMKTENSELQRVQCQRCNGGLCAPHRERTESWSAIITGEETWH